MADEEAFSTFLECPKCKKEYPPGTGHKIGEIEYCSKCYEAVKQEQPKKVCENCGKKFLETSMARYDDGLLYCKKCYKVLTSPPPIMPNESYKGEDVRGTSPAATNPPLPSSFTVTIEAPTILEALNRTVSQALSNPIRIEFAPVKLELVGGGGITVPVQVPVPSPIQTPAPVPVQPRVSTITPRPAPATTARGRPYIDSAILRVMGAKRRKWRPTEIAAELRLLPEPVEVTEQEVARVLEKLARDVSDVDSSMQIVQLSTRYMRRDHFVVEDEVDFIDLLILKILEIAGAKGIPATAIHTIAVMLNFLPVSLPTVLNHLRALKAPGWELIKKAGDGLRDNYILTDNGKNVLVDATDTARGGYELEWQERLLRMGVLQPDGSRNARTELLTEPFDKVIKSCFSDADYDLMANFIQNKIDNETANVYAKKIVALRSLLK